MESEDYTGGICGKGYTMQNCISIPAILGDGEAKGSLAGIIESALTQPESALSRYHTSLLPEVFFM